VPVHGTKVGMAAMPATLDHLPRRSFAFLFFLLPMETVVKDVLVYIYIRIYLLGEWKTCVVTFLGPVVSLCSELGPWGLG
jgi:hypothetical protein